MKPIDSSQPEALGQPVESKEQRAQRWAVAAAEWFSALSLEEVEAIESSLLDVAEEIERLEAKPEVNGYERLFREEQHHPLLARWFADALPHIGKLFQAEVQDGKRVAALVRKIASLPATSGLAISRRALELRRFCVKKNGGLAIKKALAPLSPSMGRLYFNNLIKRASAGDRGAGRELHGLCCGLRDLLPEPRGRKILLPRTTHEILLHFVGGEGNAPSYTVGLVPESQRARTDYIDKYTRATREAFAQPRFCPRRAKPALRRMPAKGL